MIPPTDIWGAPVGRLTCGPTSAPVSYSCSCSEKTTEPWVPRAGTGGRQKALWRCSLLPGSTCTPPGSELAWTWTPPPLQLLPVYIIYFVEEEYGTGMSLHLLLDSSLLPTRLSLNNTIWILLETGNNFQATCHKVSLNALSQLVEKLQLHWRHHGWIELPKQIWRDD
ncbi:uncharacterized protein [Aegilops tauschii subsp. strangulata]|uniref:uncharacterized protein n=1 Tax=Aegilops tauschii subsp. strangulata TaxID=200361 RepID=UPI003CC85461